MNYRPEGSLLRTNENLAHISTFEGLCAARDSGAILESRAAVCTGAHDLIIDLPCGKGIIPREEGAVGIKEGTTRDIALISRVNKPVCFTVREVKRTPDGTVSAVLSRKAAQEMCLRDYAGKLVPGDVIGARVTHLEQFGCFVDIGCGISSLIPIDSISVSRISHPSDRFTVGQFIKAVVKSRDGQRLCLTHKELLGTWTENAESFSPGETVSGIVRTIESYGIFVELAPNLAGLAELKEGIRTGQRVSVYIKAIIPEKMKIKLVIVDACEDIPVDSTIEYFFSGSHMDSWQYAAEESGRQMLSRFGE